jgi:hypothetical protein
MRTIQTLSTSVAMILTVSCGQAHDSSLSASPGVADVKVESAIPAERLAKLKAALPKVGYPKLQEVLQSQQTFWYDHDSMQPSYQASIKQSPPYGANSNDRWFDLIADSVHGTARNFFDENKRQWRFPFGTTAGTDNATNLKVFNFLWLPAKDGKLQPVSTYLTNSQIPGSGFSLNSWGWVYPNGAMVGELIFVTNAQGDLLPSEIRVRTRYANGWAVNAFRPFPTARSLASAIKAKRPNYASNSALSSVVNQLGDDSSLTPKSLRAKNLPKTFDEDGHLDVLPDFGDEALVKELLTETEFVSAYDTAWKVGENGATYAAGSSASLSIVPKNYEAGVIAVTEESCMRCHKETGKGLTQFSPSFGNIVLYGEMWGRDGIFSFHPFDETKYKNFWFAGTTDNRAQNPKLKAQGIIASYDAQKHKAPFYPEQEAGLGQGNLVGTPATGGGVDAEPTPDTDPTPEVNNPPSANPPPSAGAASNIVEFRIAAGTGAGEWNTKANPVVVKAGQTIRIINDDNTQHVLHTNGEPCPHGPVGNPIKKGKFYDCKIPAGTPSGSLFLTWDHFLGSPNNARFWIKVQ